MAERTKDLRRIGVRGTIAAFMVAWAIVFGQLVLGHDPALGRQHQTQTAKKAKPKASTTTTQTTQPTQPTPSVQTPAPATSSQS
jgi:hypothetical protein